MKSPRYTVLIANGKTGAMRRFSVSKPAALAGLVGVVAVPLLIGLGASSLNPAEFETLRQSNESLRLENESYRAATGELADQIASLQGALTQMGEQAELDPATRQALSRLPAVIRSRAMGGGASASVPQAVSASPDSTFGMLRNLLGAVEGATGLAAGRPSNVSRRSRDPCRPSGRSPAGSRQPMAAGPIRSTAARTSTRASTSRPIVARRFVRPPMARVESAGYSGNYGNQVLVDHGFGIGTRFGHLSKLSVRAGQTVRRGEIIGYVGATGRATGPHLHYEILLNGQPINPLRLLARP